MSPRQLLTLLQPEISYRYFAPAIAVGTLMMLGGSPAALAEEVDWARLNLDNGQRERIESIEENWRDVCGDLLPQIQRDRGELKTLLNAPNPDQQHIMELQRRIGLNKQKLDQAALQTFLQKRQHLTPPQRERLNLMMRR